MAAQSPSKRRLISQIIKNLGISSCLACPGVCCFRFPFPLPFPGRHCRWEGIVASFRCLWDPFQGSGLEIPPKAISHISYELFMCGILTFGLSRVLFSFVYAVYVYETMHWTCHMLFASASSLLFIPWPTRRAVGTYH